jgi:maltooligosyltrehalose trehalohydrolase
MSRFGPVLRPDGVRFRLWAPGAAEVQLLRPDAAPLPMPATSDGFFELDVPEARAGQRYMFRVAGHDVPDPGARQQAEDAIGWSVVRAPLPPIRQAAPPRPWPQVVLSELHVGTATPGGTFAALAEKLDHFVAAGFTAIELMPVNEFPGTRNWGYDGVLPYAPDRAYGTPAELRALVDAAHDRGLGIMLDVVYNHFGPEGNFLPVYAPSFFTEKHHTPWGAAIDLSNPIVRRYFVANAVMWLHEYDFDGLRFDAVHAFAPDGGDELLAEIAAACRAVKPQAWLVLENDNNAARWLEREPDGRPRFYDAQWNDDMHHAFHVMATGESAGYYGDYANDNVAVTARALTEGFVYQGDPSPHRDGEIRGEVSAHLPPEAFVAFLQNHDQIGNRPMGDRLAGAADPARLALLRFALLLGPQVPMLFQGEEAGLDTPFPFFCDFHGELAEAVRKGRAREFAGFFQAHGGDPSELPDPLAESTFALAKLPWAKIDTPDLAAFSELVARRRDLVWPLAATAFQGAAMQRESHALLLRWRFAGGTLAMALNPSDEHAALDAEPSGTMASVGVVGRRGLRLEMEAWSGCCWVEPS